MLNNKIIQGDCLSVLRTIQSESIDCMVTSPPYWGLRDYGNIGQLGQEITFELYINKLCDIFDEIKRVLKKDGTCFVVMGDTYGGSTKSLCQIPSRFAIEMTNRGWILRNEIIWYKPNAMPSPAKDRFTVDFEKVFFFVKSKKYFFENQQEVAIQNRWGGNKAINLANSKDKNNQFAGLTRKRNMLSETRNKRTVWKIPTKSYKEAHFATYPEMLIEPIIRAGCPIRGLVLDPFFGSGTTGVVAIKQNKFYLGIELNQAYIKIAKERLLAK